jgi:hypothetical protein
LSRLRKLETLTLKKSKQMPITYDITTDGLYLMGKEEKEKEMQAEIAAKEKESIIKMLQSGLLTIPQIANFVDKPETDIEAIAKEIGLK